MKYEILSTFGKNILLEKERILVRSIFNLSYNVSDTNIVVKSYDCPVKGLLYNERQNFRPLKFESICLNDTICFW